MQSMFYTFFLIKTKKKSTKICTFLLLIFWSMYNLCNLPNSVSRQALYMEVRLLQSLIMVDSPKLV